jgi:hypothetical protein
VTGKRHPVFFTPVEVLSAEPSPVVGVRIEDDSVELDRNGKWLCGFGSSA